MEALLLDAAGGVHQASDGLTASIFHLQVEMKDSARMPRHYDQKAAEKWGTKLDGARVEPGAGENVAD